MIELKIQVVEDGDGYAEDLDEAAQGLRQELLELDGITVSDTHDTDTPPGTRSDVQTILGVIGLSIVTGGVYVRTAPDIKKLVASIVRVVQHWQDRNKGKRALMELPSGTKVDLAGHSEASTQRIFLEALSLEKKQPDVER